MSVSFAAPWDGYPDAGAIRDRLESAVRDSDGLAVLVELGRTANGDPLWVLRIGPGDPVAPATLLVAGLDGRHLHGTELALRHIEALSADPESTKALLGGGSLWVVPTLRPDAVSSLRARPSRARATSPGNTDTDRDGLTDEDRADDLDGDGVLRWVRVEDDGGDFRAEAERPEIVHPAERTRGESGSWRLLTEGRDDDGDRRWNEEEDGGVLLGGNFPHGYKWFERNHGVHQVSETETRALADLLVAHPEIGVVLVYGFEDNLLRAWPEQKSSDPPLRGSRYGRRPIDAPNKNDIPYFRELSKRYLEFVGLDKAAGALGYRGFVTEIRAEEELPVPEADGAADGGFAAFAYYDRGLVALSTPVWTPAVQLARLKKTEEKEKGQETSGSRGDALPKEDGRTDADARAGQDASSELDAGVDAGWSTDLDAGVDAGQSTDLDAGVDAGQSTDLDAGVDAGQSTDLDAGVDAGQSTDLDAGVDADKDDELKAGVDADKDDDTNPEPSVAPSDDGDSDGTVAPLAGDESPASDSGKLPESIEDEAKFLDWLRGADEFGWKDWAPITHPDFPDRLVEVGGYAPLARVVPPFPLVDSLFTGHHAFLAELLHSSPRVAIRALALRRVDGDVYSLEVEVANDGFLPDVLGQGVYATHVRPTRFELALPSGAEVIGGTSRGPLDRLAGSGGDAEVRRLIRIPGRDPIGVLIVSEHGGRLSRQIAPGESWRRP